MKILELWDNPDRISHYKATIRWSYPKIWYPGTYFEIPIDYQGFGGIYMLIRDHWKQKEKNIIAYIGKTKCFDNRLTQTHHMHEILVKKPGNTKVSCGLIKFSGVRQDDYYYEEIEDIIKFAVWEYCENKKGFYSLPGFRTKIIKPWLIENTGYRGKLPKRILYPAFGVGV